MPGPWLVTLRERPRSARSLLTVQDAVRAICVRRAALFERSEFQHASKWHSRQEEWSTRTSQGPGGRRQPLQKNLSDRRWRPAPLVWEPFVFLHFIPNNEQCERTPASIGGSTFTKECHTKVLPSANP